MVGSLRELCSPVPPSIARPPVGSGLYRTLEAIDQSVAREPATVQSIRETARRTVRKRYPAGWWPTTPERNLAHELEVLRMEVAMLKIVAEAKIMPPALQREAKAVLLTARLYMMCGGQSGRPGAHKLACDSVAKASGVPAADVSTLIGKFFDAAGRIGTHDAYVNDGPAFLRLLSATLRAVDDLLLKHTPWVGAAADAREAEDFERMFQPAH